MVEVIYEPLIFMAKLSTVNQCHVVHIWIQTCYIIELPLLYVDGYVQPAVQLNTFTILPTAELELSEQINYLWGLKVTVFQDFMKTVKVLTWNIHITELVWNMGLQTWSFPQIVFSDDVATKLITLKFFSHTNSWQAIRTHHFWSHYWVSFPISYSVHPNYCLETMNKLYSITLWVWYIHTQWHHHWNIQYV